MVIERDSEIGARLPEGVFDQMGYLPEMSIRQEICRNLFNDIVSLLASHGIVVDLTKSSYRAKEAVRIISKAAGRRSNLPVRDIYGIQIITDEPDRGRMRDIIQSNYPATPESFPGGMPSFRDYANSQTRDYIKSTFNPHISDRYSAAHINFVFRRNNLPFFDIAEVQIMNHAELAIYNHTREEYLNARINNH